MEQILALPSDPFGRPVSLEHRMAALAKMATKDGLSTGRSVMHALCWWEESMSPSLGCNAEPWHPAWLTWHRTPDGPRSNQIDDILNAWEQSGAWYRPSDEPAASTSMLVNNEILDLGFQAAGVGPYKPFMAPIDYAPWYRMMEGFLSGFSVNDADHNPSSFRFERDARFMLLGDLVYASSSNFWELAGGPSLVKAKMPDDMSSDIKNDFVGNEAGMAIHWWLNQPGFAKDMYGAAWMYARLLVKHAAKLFPEFGDNRFLALCKTLTAVEQNNADGTVMATFSQGGNVVGQASWLLRKKEVEYGARKKTGEPLTSIVNDNSLLTFKPEPNAERVISDYMMRHVQTRDCRHAPAPPEGLEVLWSQYGCPNDSGDGSWALCPVSWPTCKTEVINAPDMQLST